MVLNGLQMFLITVILTVTVLLCGIVMVISIKTVILDWALLVMMQKLQPFIKTGIMPQKKLELQMAEKLNIHQQFQNIKKTR